MGLAGLLLPMAVRWHHRAQGGHWVGISCALPPEPAQVAAVVTAMVIQHSLLIMDTI